MQYLTPGTYIERADASAPKIAGVRTDIAAFVGIAQSGPLDTPVPVESYRQFVSHFGSFTGAGYLAYVVQGFFKNGGRRCWIVRVASKEHLRAARAASTVLHDTSGQPTWRIVASSPGVWGNELSIVVNKQRLAETVTDPSVGADRYSIVTSISGFERGTHVCLSQPGTEIWRVVSHIDANLKRVYWVHPEPGKGLRYDRALTDINLTQPAQITALSYELLVYRAGRLIARYAELSLVPESQHYGQRQLAAPVYPVELSTNQTLPMPPEAVTIQGISTVADIPKQLITPSDRLPLTGGVDGLSALTVYDFIGEPVDPHDSDTVKAIKTRGIRALDQVNEIGVVAVPDILIRPEEDPDYLPVERPQPNPCITCPPQPEPTAPPNQPLLDQELPPVFSDQDIYRVQAALLSQCEQRGDRFAILDPPFSAAQDDAVGVGAIQSWRSRFESQYGALYYPWMLVVEPRKTQPTRTIPGCGHVAGDYAAHDLQIGVHKAPANRQLDWVQGVSVAVTFGQHGLLNSMGVNVIRAEPGFRIRVLGARTLSSDPDWRFVNIRRLIIMIKKAIDLSTQWAAFEPNNTATRSKLAFAISSFLISLWQKGALTGAVVEQAFFVQCDEENNPPFERENGRLHADIGVAPSNPFEFVILRIGRQGGSFEISEANQMSRAA